jgi:hypothetical protein
MISPPAPPRKASARFPGEAGEAVADGAAPSPERTPDGSQARALFGRFWEKLAEGATEAAPRAPHPQAEGERETAPAGRKNFLQPGRARPRPGAADATT